MQIDVIRNQAQNQNAKALTMRVPEREDGSDIWELVRKAGPLDENSMYCNILQCDHFADTCIVAEFDGEIVGWVSGYVLPSEPDTFFVWQVAVDAKARGMGVAKKMLTALLERDCCKDVTKLKTTITKDNEASWALFNAFADKMDAPLEYDAHYTREEHFDGKHDTEYLVTIGDFGSNSKDAAA